MKNLLFLLLFSSSVFAQNKQRFFEMGDFLLENGQTIKNCKLGYRTFGKLNADKSNAILVPTWFSGTSDQKSFITSPTNMADSTKFFVIIVDALGNGVSSSPSNSATQSNLLFPQFSIRDMVKSEYELASKHLGLSKLYAVMGISMGGMQTFQWVVSYPDFIEKAVPIIGTPKQSSYDKLFWNSQLTIIERSNYNQESMKNVGALHEMNLWTPAYHEKTFKPENYQKYIIDKETDYVKYQNVFNWASQLRAMINHDIFNGKKAEIIAKIKAKMMIVVASQDHMVNPASAIDLGKDLKAPVLELSGDCGHMATACEADKMNAFVKGFLE